MKSLSLSLSQCYKYEGKRYFTVYKNVLEGSRVGAQLIQREDTSGRRLGNNCIVTFGEAAGAILLVDCAERDDIFGYSPVISKAGFQHLHEPKITLSPLLRHRLLRLVVFSFRIVFVHGKLGYAHNFDIVLGIHDGGRSDGLKDV